MKARFKVEGHSHMGKDRRGITLYPVDHESTRAFFNGPLAGSFVFTVDQRTADDQFKPGSEWDLDLTPVAATGKPANQPK